MTEREELLERLDNVSSENEVADIADNLLAINPQDPYGLFASWGLLDHNEQLSRVDMLYEAYETTHNLLHEKDSINDPYTDRDSVLFMSVSLYLGFALLERGEAEEALTIAHTLAHHDEENLCSSRALLYAAMTHLEMWNEILDHLMEDKTESIAGAYAGVLAMLETSEPKEDVDKALFDAVSLDPRIPLYVIGILELREGEELSNKLEPDLYFTISSLIEIWNATEKRTSYISMFAFTFAYLRSYMKDKKEINFFDNLFKESDISKKVDNALCLLNQSKEAGKTKEQLDIEALLATRDILKDLDDFSTR